MGETANEEVGLGRIQANQKISDALITSIFAGHLMFSSTPREEVIREFTERISRLPPAADPKSKPKD